MMSVIRIQILLVLVCLAGILTSCSSTYTYSGQRPRELNFATGLNPTPQVLIGADTVLIKPYIILKEVTSNRLASKSKEKMINSLQYQGQQVGADAIIKIETTTYRDEHYTLLDMLTDENYGDSREIRTFREVRGLAIKYIENVKKRTGAPKSQEYFVYLNEGQDSMKMASYQYDLAGTPSPVFDSMVLIIHFLST